ncbi:dipeptide/oligopeptide/nickel ABC transporter permease/ATP-binding protein [Actinomadura viridis]|uniref:Peptide/nickel transport system permease protein n=1 Tax=Actinomadura viridis TaxID=58110 RepID=A0A931GIQ0_9ACTN|nr:dipeptide/oligopeptide/nickel ABC transporter permease/ATP-binding protein [Actinomadura viridis]MBG6088833.1 peptide/nickel transport system permease protein [Actinomadura viridis]
MSAGLDRRLDERSRRRRSRRPGAWWRGLAARPAGLVALLVLNLLVLACVGASLIAPHDPRAQDLANVLAGPSAGHPLGTDTLGRDVLSRILFGGRRTFLSVAEGVAAVLIVGVPLGLVAGYAGRLVDQLLGRLSDVVMAIPAIILVLVVLAVLPQNQDAAMVTFGLLGAPGVLRVVRGAALKVREEPYITAARVAGLSHARIIARHVLPRVRGPVIVQATIFAAYALLFETGLAYLGLTADPTAPTWGGMVAEASTVIQQQSWLLWPSGMVIAITIVAFGLLGDTIRDAAVGGGPGGKPAGAGAGGRRQARPAEPPPVPRSGTPRRESPVLTVRGLSVALADGDRETLLVDGVGFDVMPGETVGLVGESGCGKSVTALALLRLLPRGLLRTGGEVIEGDRDLLRLPGRTFDLLRGSALAYISQEPQAALDPMVTIGRQMEEVVAHHDGAGRAAARARALELLAMVEIRDPVRVAASCPHEISGGMAQRVAIALALAGRPRLLIADEPTTALDVTVQAEVLGLLRRLQGETGMAILLITHDWGVVADLCDRTLVMYAGQIVEECAVEDVYDRPLHPYTRGLLRSHPSLAADGEPLLAMPGQVPAPADWPRGCRFAARCPLAGRDCTAAPIPLADVGEGRLSRCLRTDRLLVEEVRS